MVLEFDNAEDRDDFVGWFLDGGGEYQFNDGRDGDGKPTLDTETRVGREDWDWKDDPDGDEHVIRMPRIQEDE